MITRGPRGARRGGMHTAAAAVGLCAWVAASAVVSAAVCVSGPAGGSSPPRPILARLSCPRVPVVLTLRGGDGDGLHRQFRADLERGMTEHDAKLQELRSQNSMLNGMMEQPEVPRGSKAKGAPSKGGGGGDGADDGADGADDGADRDRQMRDAEVQRVQGRGEPCVDWRAYRPKTEAEQRRESQLAGKVAPACARAGAFLRRADVGLRAVTRGRTLPAEPAQGWRSRRGLHQQVPLYTVRGCARCACRCVLCARGDRARDACIRACVRGRLSARTEGRSLSGAYYDS